MKIIKDHINQLITLCEKYKVDRLFVFGSVANGAFIEERSDLDFIAELESMDPLTKGENLLRLWDELEDLFGRKVDLLSDKPIKNPYLKTEIERTKLLIYDKQREEVFCLI